MGELREKYVRREVELGLQLPNAQSFEGCESLRAKEIELEGVKRELENGRAIVDVMESVVRSLEEEVGRKRRRRRVNEGRLGCTNRADFFPGLLRHLVMMHWSSSLPSFIGVAD
ncbi:hypothetical protein FA13DRAFT_1780003 [Coprinellus micaceus]|uniref:Uncharacterized protein n=1 Tax=Coprinellus micaceus TaxID=71717 RepID=A0A4Y7SF46_COPMI|nr:hypothetical protein FA13DRAFT_1780003 [Coprinellus micaceus]